MVGGLFVILIPLNPLMTKLYSSDLKTQIVPHSKHNKPWL